MRSASAVRGIRRPLRKSRAPRNRSRAPSPCVVADLDIGGFQIAMDDACSSSASTICRAMQRASPHRPARDALASVAPGTSSSARTRPQILPPLPYFAGFRCARCSMIARPAIVLRARTMSSGSCRKSSGSTFSATSRLSRNRARDTPRPFLRRRVARRRRTGRYGFRKQWHEGAAIIAPRRWRQRSIIFICGALYLGPATVCSATSSAAMSSAVERSRRTDVPPRYVRRFVPGMGTMSGPL